MPNNGIRIYTENGKGIDIRNDVYKILGISPRSNGFDIGYACGNTHGKINPWAKYKPEATGGARMLTLMQRQENNFGLRASHVYGTHHDFESAVRNNSLIAGFTYIAPGAGNFKRIGDFNGYDSQAASPFGSVSHDTRILSAAQADETIITGDDPRTDPENGILASEFRNVDYTLRDWYFGLCLYNTKRVLTATTADPVSSLTVWDVNFGHIPPAYSGIYTAYPFLCSGIIRADGSYPGETMTIALDAKGVRIDLIRESEMFVVDLVAWYPDKSSDMLKYRIRITSKWGTSRICRSLVLQLAKSEEGADSISALTFASSNNPITFIPDETWEASGEKRIEGYGGNPAQIYTCCRLAGDIFSDMPWSLMDEDVDEDDMR